MLVFLLFLEVFNCKDLLHSVILLHIHGVIMLRENFEYGLKTAMIRNRCFTVQCRSKYLVALSEVEISYSSGNHCESERMRCTTDTEAGMSEV